MHTRQIVSIKLKIVLSLIIFLLLFTSFAYAEELNVNAKSAILYDMETGRILWGKNINVKRPMASTTKIMTAVIALEKGNLDDTVTASPKACAISGSSIWLQPGEKLKLKDLIYGMMLKSGNDAATAVAQHIGGNVETFVEMMNKKAIDLGAYNTSFANPHGLDDHKHYSTALDLAIIGSYALKNPQFAQIVKTKQKIIDSTNKQKRRQIMNINKLLWQYEGADGVKTGYTSMAGHCLVGSATRDGWQLISVVLKCPSRYCIWQDTIKLLKYGFNNFYKYNAVKKHQIITTVEVLNGKADKLALLSKEDINIPLKKGEEQKVNIKVKIPDKIEAPITKNQPIGKLMVYFDSKLIKETELVAEVAVERKSFIDIINRFLNTWIY